MPLVLRHRRRRRGSLMSALMCSTQMVNDVTSNMYSDHYHWQKNILGHNYNVSHDLPSTETASLAQLFRSWLGTHEEAQVMLGSVLVVIALWWLVRAVLSLVIHLVCPLLVVLLAVVCVPQLRGPLLGQNYPVLANLLHNILIKLAENIKS
ncbi:uncharacterized protein LOC128679501 isoform X3 [Plodia interpunctella]|uniref:uncharacterized protein LOC128679501 isoform X3 n=1 Tax=Plodia interpunctella TaxID=58824 RepID=UPI002367E1A9|nr:uncharacterized protein LOC128679501 isoform X2 [Plodia interpunctella]